MADFINYGNNQIDQQAFLDDSANSLESYIQSQPWSNKRKELFRQAYQDIMSRGVTGADNSSGTWKVTHKGNQIDMNSKSKKEREMYNEAAYYIQQRMNGLNTKKTNDNEKKEEPIKKKDYKNADFQNGLAEFIGKQYGGRERSSWNQDWLDLDSEDKGIRGTANRQARMAEYLSKYRDYLKEKQNDYDFSTGPYDSFDNWSSRVDAAISALNNQEWNQQDKDTLNSLGLDYRSWFDTGADTPVKWTDSNGQEHVDTRANYNALVAEAEAKQRAAEQEAKIASEQAKQKAAAAKAKQNVAKYRGIFGYNWNNDKVFRIGDFKANSIDDIVKHVASNFSNIQSNDEFSKKANEIQGAYSILNDNNKLKPVSDELFKRISSSKGIVKEGGKKEHYKLFEGIDNIIYNTRTGNIYYLDTEYPTKKVLDTVQQYRQKQKEAIQSKKYNPYGVDMATMNFKQGGTINRQKIQQYKQYIKK